MNSQGSKHVVRFVLIILVQILILNLNMHGLVNPYVYPLFLLLLPFEIAHVLLLFYGFVLGLSIDMFTNTMGIHAATTVFIAYIRPYILTFLMPSGGYDADTAPRIKDMGFVWFAAYSFIIVLLHHIVLFSLEVLRLSEILYVLGKSISSTLLAMIIILFIEYLSFSRKSGKRYGR